MASLATAAPIDLKAAKSFDKVITDDFLNKFKNGMVVTEEIKQFLKDYYEVTGFKFDIYKCSEIFGDILLKIRIFLSLFNRFPMKRYE